MTISSTTNTVSYTGNGSTTAFAVPYVFFGTGTTSEVEVVEVVIATGAETVKSNGSDYTVAGGSGATGTVTAATAPASTVKWVINRATTQTQETDYVENDPFPAESHEEALDRLTAIDQEQQRALDRTAQLPDGYTGSFDPTLPVDITGSTVLAFNAGATAFEVGPTTSAISGAAAAAAAAASSATASAGSATAAAASAATASAYAGTQTVDLFNGTGSQTAFTLSVAPANGDENNTDVHISGVYQQKNTYSLSGTTLTFSTAPPSGTGNVEVMHMSQRAIETPADGSVTYPKFASGLVDTDLSAVSGSDDTIASAKAIKTYVDTQIGSSNELSEVLANGNTSGGTNIVVSAGDSITTDTIAETTAAAGVTIDGVLVKDGQVDGRDVSVDGAKLDGIEAAADVTDTGNVTAAGALMDSELTNLAAVKALDQGVATTDTPTFAGVITAGNVDGRDVSVDGAKLDGIEAGADVTDTANVTAAGAVMDSELTNITAVKALNQGVATTDSPSFAGLTATTADINGGTIDGMVIGGASAAAGTFTTITTSGNVGIGVSPSYRLDVYENAATTHVRSAIRNPHADAYNASHIFVTTNRQWEVGAFDNAVGLPNGYWGVRDDTAAAYRFLIDNIGQAQFLGSQVSLSNAAGPALMNEAASSTNPTLVPNKATPATGMGASGSNTGYLISNGAEHIRWGNGAVTVTGAFASTGSHTVGTNSSGNSATLQQANNFQFKLNGDTASQLGTVSWTNNSGATTANLWATGDSSSGGVVRLKGIGHIDLVPGDVGITGAAGYRHSTGVFTPPADNSQTLGSASLRWSTVYAGTGSINTSDERLKQQIKDLDTAELVVAKAIKGMVKKFKFNDAVAEKGDKARIHVGVIAQEVRDAFIAEGLDPTRYSLFCYDEWDEIKEETDEDGTVLVPARPAGNRFGIRYDELLAFIIAAIQGE